MPRKRIEATTYEKPEAEDPATVATTAPEGAPNRRRARKAKVDEAATTAPKDATEGTTIDTSETDTTGSPEADANDAPVAAPAPRRKRSTRKRKPKPAANTGADTANTGPKGDVTVNQLAELYQRHLQDAGKSLGTQFSYAQDFQVAVRFLGEKTKLRSLTPAKVQAYYDSDAVTKTKSGRGKAQPTIAKTRRVLRLALVWAAETGLIATAPLPPKGD